MLEYIQPFVLPLYISLLYFINSNLLSALTVREHLRVRWYHIVLLVLIETILNVLIRSWLWFGNIPFVLIMVGLYCLLVDQPPMKLIYIQLIITTEQVILNDFLYLLEGSSYTWTWSDMPLVTLVFALSTPPMLWLLRRGVWPRLRDVRVDLARLPGLWSVPLVFIAMNLLLSSSHIQAMLSRSMGAPYIILTMLFSLTTAATCLLILNMLERASTAALAEGGLHMTSMLLSTEAKRFAELTQHMEEVRVLRHDMRHHLRMVQLLLDENKCDELRAYLREYAAEAAPEGPIFSANFVGDLVARHTQLRAQQAGIDIDIHCALPADCFIADTDLCTVLGNLTENALNACILQREGPRRILARARIVGNDALVTIENTCDDSDTPARRAEVGLPPSTGHGMASIQAIAQKYGGMASFERRGDMFYAAVMLSKPQHS